MKRRLSLLFLWIVFLLGPFSASSHDYGIRSYGGVSQAPGRRSLLSDAKVSDPEFVAALDGTIYRLDDSGKPLWSFSSGPQIYSSYQAPINDTEIACGLQSKYFIVCGDDWELYAHSSLGKLKLMKTIEEYISSTPQITEDGGVVLGSKETTAFLVGAKTGRVIHTYKLSDLPSTTQSSFSDFPYNTAVKELESDEPPLYFTRTDYRLKSFKPNSNEVLWNLSVAEVVVAFLCQDVEKSLSGKNMPMPCHSRISVNRNRTHSRSEILSLPHGPEKALHDDMMLPNVENVRQLLPSSTDSGKSRDTFNENGEVISKPLHLNFGASLLFLISSAFLVFAVYLYCKAKLALQSTGTSSTNIHSKRKKPRKAGKGGSNESGNNFLLNLNEPNSCSTGGRRIGKLVVTGKEIAKGSNGTIVLEGIYEGRQVAVKRLVRAYNDIAFKEIQNLIVSDHHPNIVTWYGVEQDHDFVYIALERCDCSLNDLILMHFNKNLDAEVTASVKGVLKEFELWNSDGCPSRVLLKLMRDVVSGIVHLHELGIIHRDLKPQNVLITSERSLCARLSDMGISKRLAGDMSSLSNHATGYGSSGWQAPEQLLHGRQTRAVDLFSLGSVLFFCITGGRHPFGNHLERDVNITKNKLDLFLVGHIPEAVDLFLRLLNPNAELRPRAVEVLDHPLFWSSEMRLSFLRDTSDRVELEDREAESGLLKSLENIAPLALGGKWNEKMEPSFLNNIGHYRRYKFDSVRDLLRVIRNKLNHYRELPAEIQEIIGTVPEGFDRYFRNRFPKLLIEVYKVMIVYCSEEECFSKYFNGSEQL